MKHTCKICCRKYNCVWCNDTNTLTKIGCMNLPPKIYPRLEHFHFICSKNCMNHLVDNWSLIDKTAKLDISFNDLQQSINRNKKRKLNDITKEDSTPMQTVNHEHDMPPCLAWSSLPCAYDDSSTFFAHLRGQQMNLEKDGQNEPFCLDM